ncbi:MAG: hypothetical protein ACYSP9_08185 [Planctomycetota bacterium]|jgi:hypothetical protein
MAQELTLVVGSTEIDLLEGSDGLTLRLDGWIPQVAKRNGSEYENVIETITLKARDTSVAGLINNVTAQIEEAIDWIDDHINDPVAFDLAYLKWRPPGQSQSIQAVIKELSFAPGNSLYFPPATNQSALPNLVLQIERLPFWETVSYPLAYTAYLDSGGESGYVTKTDLGSVPGRIDKLFITTTKIFNEFWIGFRTDKYGYAAYFNPLWTFDVVTTSNDATESGGTVTWTSGDTDLLERMRISMSQRTNMEISLYRYQRGTFTVLLRARSTGTETFNVRLTDGFYSSSSSNRNRHSRVKVSGTSFQFYALGTVTIPPIQRRAGFATGMGNYTLGLDAEVNTSGTGSLEATRFVLIPQDEGYVHVDGIATGLLGSTEVTVSPDGRISAYTINIDSTVDTPSALDMHRYGLPQTETYLTLAAHGSAQTLGDTARVEMLYVNRWLGLGGF